MIILIPFFIVSIGTYIIINRDFYNTHPLLFKVYIFVCILLFIVLIFLLFRFNDIIWQYIDYYFVKVKTTDPGNARGPSPGSGPGSRPSSGSNGGDQVPSNTYPGPNKSKGKQKQEKTESEHIPHVVKVSEDYAK